MKRNISLDFFRGVMAIGVALLHFFYWNEQTDKIPYSFALAVDFFLVLSGFVISASVFNKETFQTHQFILNRYLRLLPVYLFCVLITIIPHYFFIPDFPKPNSLDYLKILAIGELLPLGKLRLVASENVSWIHLEPLGVSYTISAEFWVGIILFPMVVFLRKQVAPLLLPFLIGIIMFSLLKISNDSPDFLLVHHGEAYPFIHWGMIRCLLDYAIGIVAYIVFAEQNQKKSSPVVASIIQISIIVICFLLYRKITYNRVNEFVFPLICAVFIVSLAKNQGVVFHAFNHKVGAFFGNISYPIYLIHPLCILIFRWLGVEVTYLNGVFFLLLSMVFAFLIHQFIEKPCMLYFKQKWT